MKKIKYFLQKWDGFWSVPLSFLAFFFVGVLLSTIFGYGTGSYDVAFIQPLFLSATIVIGATNAGVFGLYFTFRGFHDFLYGKKVKDKETEDDIFLNYSKIKWTKLTGIQQFSISLLTLAYFISAIIIVYLKLV